MKPRIPKQCIQSGEVKHFVPGDIVMKVSKRNNSLPDRIENAYSASVPTDELGMIVRQASIADRRYRTEEYWMVLFGDQLVMCHASNLWYMGDETSGNNCS